MPRFIVLDDITSSFDSGHQFLLMDVIKNRLGLPANQDGLQFILLSHEALLDKYFDTAANSKDWHHQKLSGNPPQGYLMTQSQDKDRLKVNAERLLNAGQTEQASNLIRQYMEFKLLEIINRVQISVPLDFSIKDSNKMIDNAIKAIEFSVGLHSDAGRLILNSSQLNDFKNSFLPRLISNWINHYATGVTASFTPSVLQGVLNDIDSLAECFKYDCHCNGTTTRRYYKRLDMKYCQC